MPGRQSRFSFLAKILAALALIAGADRLFADGRIGSWLGGLALAWLITLFLARPALRHGPALVQIPTGGGYWRAGHPPIIETLAPPPAPLTNGAAS
jgi:hypothetical protein